MSRYAIDCLIALELATMRRRYAGSHRNRPQGADSRLVAAVAGSRGLTAVCFTCSMTFLIDHALLPMDYQAFRSTEWQLGVPDG